jgi:hypothetical protein
MKAEFRSKPSLFGTKHARYENTPKQPKLSMQEFCYSGKIIPFGLFGKKIPAKRRFGFKAPLREK